MVVTIYFIEYPNDSDIKEWKFIYNEFSIPKLTDYLAQVYKYNKNAIIKEINIKRV